MSGAKQGVAIVTGGRRGIGRAIAEALAGTGFDIALTGLEAPDAHSDALVARLMAMGAARAIYLRSDLADLDAHGATVASIEAALGPVDCLINNAGMASVMRGDFLDLTPENYDRIMAVNLRGTVFFTQAVVRAMLAQPSPPGRSIITISSVSAEMTSPDRIDYCLSKAGLAAFSKGLTLRLAAEAIAVFEVRPGIIRSDMTAQVSEKYDRLITGGLVPAGRWGEPEDVGRMVAALAGGELGFATGSVLNVDGGLSVARL